MGTITFMMAGTLHTIPDLGPELNEEFLRLYDSFINGCPFDLSAFHKQVEAYLDKNAADFSAHDRYFNAFGGLWKRCLDAGNFAAAESVWKLALDPVRQWEKRSGKRAHKGTPYYFWAVTVFLLAGDIDRGFVLMHHALNEDVETTRQKVPPTPGNAFVTLDYNEVHQFFRQWVLEAAQFLETFLSVYRSGRSRQMTLDELRAKFLSNPDVRPAALFFVFLLHKLKAFRNNIAEGVTKSDFAGLLELDLLFGFCLVTDQVIKHKHSNPKAMFRELAVFLSQKAGLGLGDAEMTKLHDAFKADFGGAVHQLLQGVMSKVRLQPMEADVGLCYGIRNQGAHNIEGHQSVYDNFEEISQRVLNTFFLSVETIY